MQEATTPRPQTIYFPRRYRGGFLLLGRVVMDGLTTNYRYRNPVALSPSVLSYYVADLAATADVQYMTLRWRRS